MFRMHRHIASIVILVFFCTALSAQPDPLAQRVREIADAAAMHLVANEDAGPALAPGGIIGIYVEGKVFYFPYGRIDDEGHAPTKDTIFGLGSITKTFTTSILGQRPEIFTQAVTAQPLPPGYQLQPTEAPVTFEQLATFTGAISPPRNPGNCGHPSQPACDQQLFVAFINSRAPRDGKLPAPNVYSNAGIGFLAQVLMFRDGFTSFGAAETGQWFEKHLFDHVGMSRTGYPPKHDAQHPLSKAFAYDDDDHDYRVAEYAGWVPWGAAGRDFSTAEDMVRYIQAYVGVSDIDGRQVPEKILAGMRQALIPRAQMSKQNAARQAFAWVTWPEELPRKSQISSKDGGITGVSAYVAVNPPLKYGVITLTNMAGVPVQGQTLEMMNELEAMLIDRRR